MPKKSTKRRAKIEKTNCVLCVGGHFSGLAVGLEHGSFLPLSRMPIPSVQDARQCIIRMKSYLGVSLVDLGSVLSIPRNTICRWANGKDNPPLLARLLLPRLERELIPQDEYQDLFPPTTGSVQPAQDVILPTKPGHQA